MTTERDHGADLLRIISMGMILILHILGQGGLLAALPEASVRYKAAWFMETACYGAVNCCALISGYVGVNAKFRYSNILRLWLQVVFYTVGAAVLLHIVRPDSVGRSAIGTAFFPVSNGRYWYYTAYFCMSFFIPAMNHLVNTMPKRPLQIIAWAIVLLFSVYPMVMKADIFDLSGGYCVAWLALLYILGGCLQRYPLSGKLTPAKCLGIYLILTVISWAWKLYTDGLPAGTDCIDLVDYTSPTILVGSIMLLVGLSRCRFPKPVRAVIQFFAPLSFSVYLVHAQWPVFSTFMAGKYAYLSELHTVKIMAAVLGIALFWFLLATMIDFLRLQLFRLLKVNRRCVQLGDAVERLLFPSGGASRGKHRQK